LPLREQTLGIVGLGRIGKALALRARGLDMRLLACEIAPDQAFLRQHPLELVPFEELLARSDFVSLHVPLTPLTRQMINRRTLSVMKPSAFLVNTARGGVINEEDLLEALKEGRIAGAGLDVFAREPAGKHPLLELDNVIATPHTAGVDRRSRDEMAWRAAQAIVRLLRGEWPAEQIVNPDVKSAFEQRRRE
jgi:D-3-phosphoglycerate dehydrogenase